MALPAAKVAAKKPNMRSVAKTQGLKGVGKGYWQAKNKKVFKWSGAKGSMVARARPASMLGKAAKPAVKPAPKPPPVPGRPPATQPYSGAAPSVQYTASETAGMQSAQRGTDVTTMNEQLGQSALGSDYYTSPRSRLARLNERYAEEARSSTLGMASSGHALSGANFMDMTARAKRQSDETLDLGTEYQRNVLDSNTRIADSARTANDTIQGIRGGAIDRTLADPGALAAMPQAAVTPKPKPAAKPGAKPKVKVAHKGAKVMKAAAKKSHLKGVGKGYYKDAKTKKVYRWNGAKLVPASRPKSMLPKPKAKAKKKGHR